MESCEVRIGFPIKSNKRIKFKHQAEMAGSNMTAILNDFIDLYIQNKLKPEDIKKLTVK